jgi:alcohol dehydrogenase
MTAYHSRGVVRSTATALSPASWSAAGVALQWGRHERMRRLADITAGRLRNRGRGTVRALVAGRGARLTWKDVPRPPAPGPDAAVVAPLAMATCDLDRPIALGATPFPLPLSLGHECVAEVLSAGERVGTVRPGDRVVVPFQISCGTCPACRTGRSGNCRRVPPLSMYGFGVAGGLWGGAIADRLTVPYADAMLVPLPAGVSPAAAASAADTLGDAYRHIAPHVDRVRDHPDGPGVAIVGAVSRRSVFGASVPLYAALIARALLPGADIVIGDERPFVRAHAERLGLTAVPVAALRRRRAPLVVDSSASPRGLARALRITAPDGHCTCAGLLHASARVPASMMFGRNATLSIARSHVRSAIPGVLDMIASGRLHPESVTTTLAGFDDAPDALRAHVLDADIKTVLVRDR